jgi:hypothetical protein
MKRTDRSPCRAWWFSAGALLALLASTPAALAETVEWRGTAVVAAIQFQDAMIAQPSNSGRTSYRNVGAVIVGDEAAHMIVTGEVEQRQDELVYWGNLTVDYPDGSRLLGHVEGEVPLGASPATDTGTFTFTDGEGRFAGAHGGGRYSGEMLVPIAEGGTTVYRFDGTIELPD